jgi:hypothetical protein
VQRKISEIISSLPAASGQPIGASTGNGGVAALPMTSPESARAWLANLTPAEVDDRIRRSLTSRHGVDASVSKEWRFPERRAPYQVAISAGLTGLSTASHPQVVAQLEAAMTPVTREQAEELVVQMQSVLARRAASEDTAEVAFDVYVHVFLQHPADVAIEATRRMTLEPRQKGAAWMPSPPELEALCRSLSSERRAMLFAAKAWIEPTVEVREVRWAENDWREAQAEARRLSDKVGPGPAQDTGERGERIAAWEAAVEKAGQLKLAYLAAQKRLEDIEKKTVDTQ